MGLPLISFMGEKRKGVAWRVAMARVEVARIVALSGRGEAR